MSMRTAYAPACWKLTTDYADSRHDLHRCRNSFVEDFERHVNVFFLQYQRWGPANGLGSCAEDNQSAFETRRFDSVSQFLVWKLNAEHQPEAAHVLDAIMFLLKLH